MSEQAVAYVAKKSSAQLQQERLEREKLEREKARRDFATFREYMWPGYQTRPHNLLIAQTLMQVELFIRTEGQEGIGRLMIFMPARTGKSTDVARFFPTFLLGRNPDKRVAITSYAASLSDGHSRAVRNFVMSHRFSVLFGDHSTLDTPVKMSDDSASVSDWDLAEPYHGGCVSRGLGGGLSGKGAHLLIADDLTKDFEEAASENHQKKLEEWWDSVAYQRLEKGGAIINIQTRYNVNDLPGQLLKRMGSDDPHADQWKVLVLPSRAYEEDLYPKTEAEFKENLIRGIYIPMGGDQLGRLPGEPLWPEKFSLADIQRKEANVSPLIFAAMDQQLPREITGGFFVEKDIQIIEASEVPPDLTWCAYVDLALGNSKKSDRNAVMPETINPETGDLIGRDLIVERDMGRFLKLLKMAMLDPINKKVIWGFESVAFQTLVFEDFRKDAELAAVAMMRMIPHESKEDRALRVSLRSKEGHFKLVRGSWNQTAIREMLDFPSGTHDDIVDTVSGGQDMIAKFGNREKRAARSYQG
jgi:phage terminase large subunit-like protein